MPQLSNLRPNWRTLLRKGWPWWQHVQTLWEPLWPGLLSATGVWLLLQLGALDSVENLAYTLMFHLRGAQAWDDRVVIIEIDEASVQRYGIFPWPRHYYTDLLYQLQSSQPAAIGFDLILAEPTPEDDRLSEAMAFQGGVVLALAADGRGETIAWLPPFQKNGIPGHVDKRLDTDGITRYIYPELGNVPNFGLALVQLAALNTQNLILPENQQPLFSPPSRLSLDQLGPRLWVNWPGSVASISHYSFGDVLDGQVDPQAFQNKIVLVGTDLTGADPLYTPFDQEPPTSGVYLHAAVIHNILNHNSLQRPPLGLVMWAIWLVAPLFSWGIRTLPLRYQCVLGTIVTVIWLPLGLLALHHNLWIPIVVPTTLLTSISILSIFTKQVQANAMLKARSQFLAMMSHELRTPISGVIGMTSLLLDTPLTKDQNTYTEVIRSSGEALLALVNDILDYSKIESGHLELESRSLCLMTLVEDCLDLISPKALEKGVELAYYLDPEVPCQVRGDVTRLRQILLNLLSNAVKFTDQGHIIVWMRHAPSSKTQKTPLDSIILEVGVEDTGIGISAKGMERLFRAFMQVDASTTRKYGGTGLGLVISQRLAELMGGQMWVVSRDGHNNVNVGGQPPSQWSLQGLNPPRLTSQGSCFCFSFEALADDSDSQPSLPSPGGCGKWLVLHPSERLGGLLARQLNDWGAEAQWVSRDALEGLGGSRSFPYRGVILSSPNSQSAWLDLLGILKPLVNEGFRTIVLLPLGETQLPKTSVADQLQPETIVPRPIKRQAIQEAIQGIAPQPEPTTRKANASHSPQLSSTTLDLTPTDPTPTDPIHSLAILIAEDNQVNQKVALHLLSKIGYRADLANTGLEVLEALRRRPYDVVFMDLHMPDMDGLTATRQIRQTYHNPPLIVALSASDYEDDRLAFELLGVHHYLCKPFRKEDFARILSQFSPV